MENQDTIDVSSEGGMKKRPTFLTVICILTFISVGFGLLVGLFNLSTGPVSSDDLEIQTEDMAELLDEMPNEIYKIYEPYISGVIEMTEYTNDHFYRITLTTFLFSLVKLLGVIMMFKLKRKGFALYAVGDIAEVIHLPLLLTNSFTIAITWFSGFFTVLFVLFYALNLKHMR